MTAPVWLSGPDVGRPSSGERPIVWYGRLDDPAIAAHATAAPLRTAVELAEIAGRPHAAMRGLRRQLARWLLARVADVHPDAVRIERTPHGAIAVAAPVGWHASVAGRWPDFAIAVAREPVGVDIEPILTESLPLDLLSPDERARAASSSPFDWTACWVAKEAHAKRIGQAASIDPSKITTGVAGEEGVAVSSANAESRCHLRRHDTVVIGLAMASGATG